MIQQTAVVLLALYWADSDSEAPLRMIHSGHVHLVRVTTSEIFRLISRYMLTIISVAAVCTGGFYMYGDVGCGKTMLMDMFLEALPVTKKKRVHFNSFMQQFHDAIHKWRSSPQVKVHSPHFWWNETASFKYELTRGWFFFVFFFCRQSQQQSDALDFITNNIIEEGRLLCFDEFQVTNIADAMMLGRLFTCVVLFFFFPSR